MKQLDVNDYGFAHLTLNCCCTTLWNGEVVVWPFTTTSSYWVVHASAQLLFQDGVYCRRQTVD